MPRCAFLTMDDVSAFAVYDHLTHAPLAARGWSVDEVPWRADADWDAYDAVVVRSPWDYQDDPGTFLRVLEAIDRSRARLENPLALVRWNIDKRYLREIEAGGVPIVPTVWGDALGAERLAALPDALGADQFVVKPVVSANADDTFWLRPTTDAAMHRLVLHTFAARPWMAQPFVRSVVEEGEFSLFYFGGAYSHAILKTPASGDFRVQEEHGGRIRAIEPEPALRAAADASIDVLDPAPLYARTDLVRLADGSFAVMELELIEPSLYFPYDAASPERFAEAFVRWMDV